MNNIQIFSILGSYIDDVPVISALAVSVFLVGAVLLYKKGLWPGLSICLASIFLIIIAMLGNLISL